MKKTYTKPEIMFEDFSLSTSIALACKYGAHHAEYACPYEDEDMMIIVFIDHSMGCQDLVENGIYNGLCYHNPDDDTKIFAS